jgi:hypothetical protein
LVKQLDFGGGTRVGLQYKPAGSIDANGIWLVYRYPHHPMNNFLFLALLPGLLGCATTTDRSVDYTKGLAGTYTMTYMDWDGDVARMPEPGFAGSITMTKADFTHLRMVFAVRVEGDGELVSQSSDAQLIELKPSGGTAFFLYDGAVKLGTISPSAIAIKTKTESGDGRVEIRASR